MLKTKPFRNPPTKRLQPIKYTKKAMPSNEEFVISFEAKDEKTTPIKVAPKNKPIQPTRSLKQEPVELPGPGAYTVEVVVTKGAVFGKADRDTRTNDSPGPGEYLQPLSMLKPSHNVRL